MFNSGQIISKQNVRMFLKTSTNESAIPIMIGTSSGSGPSYGRLHQEWVLVSTRLKFNGFSHVMKEVYRVTSYKKPFIEVGDSGSGVFVQRQGKLYCIGIALSKDVDSMIGYVTPIDSALGVLRVNYKLKQIL